MAENDEQSEEERVELFRYLQGEVTFEQFQVWKEMNRQTGGLVIKEGQGPEKSANRDSSIILQGVDLPGTSRGDATSIGNTLSVSQVWDYLESNEGDEETIEEDVLEPADSGVLDLASANSRVSQLSKLREAADSDSTDISQVALSVRPDLLAEYLTGKMDFDEFYQQMSNTKEEIQKKRNKSVRLSDEWVDGAEFDENDEEDELSDEERDDKEKSWEPDEKEKPAKGKKKRKPRRRLHELPKDLLGLMGEANLKCAQGKYEEAIKMCMEIIRRAPQASEPFHTLGVIYEHLGDATKATEFFLLSVHLRRDDPDEWARVAELLLGQNETQKAIHCYNQAIKHAVGNKAELLMERTSLLEQIGETNKALIGYTQVLSSMPSDPSYDDKYLELARSVCKSYHEMIEESYHEMKKDSLAARVLRTMFETRPSLISAEDANMLLELHLSLKEYQPCLEVLVSYCGVEARLTNDTPWTQANPLPQDADIHSDPHLLTSIRVPDLMPVDLRAKLCVCLIYLGFKLLAEEHVTSLMQGKVEEIGDLFYDVAEAYMENSYTQEALPIFQRLVQSADYNQAGVWLRYGECLSSLGQLEEAVQAFSRVVEMAPNHLGARVSLSALQQQVGKHDEALRVLSGGSGEADHSDDVDKTLLLHKCHLLFSQGHRDEFIRTSRRLLFTYFEQIYKPGFLKVVFHYKSVKHRVEALRTYLGQHGETIFGKEVSQEEGDGKPSTSSGKLCNVLLEDKKYEDVMEVTLLGLSCPTFLHDVEKMREAEFMCLVACLVNKNSQFAYNFAKEICLKDPDSVQAWNLFRQAVAHATDIRHHKFCLRQLTKHPDNPLIAMMEGHNSIQNGTYRQALGNYVSVFRKMPTDPLVSFCIGLTYIHLCGQKFAVRKHWLAIQGFAFLNSYLQLRGECQESYYNLGRAMHQLNLKYAAVYYYKKALELPPVIKHENGMYDLTREIAFNLSLIYQASGSTNYARSLYEKYIVI
ncbi:hypothetical protein BaRGS_00019298 [Batillaria attramentaria]|uniref:General transcription factor 3C polypeptide 3 n=1 Tax=Batillaria attramentaria TaxID=370345 RepID=A0ABD0KQQ4_9CAEN